MFFWVHSLSVHNFGILFVSSNFTTSGVLQLGQVLFLRTELSSDLVSLIVVSTDVLTYTSMLFLNVIIPDIGVFACEICFFFLAILSGTEDIPLIISLNYINGFFSHCFFDFLVHFWLILSKAFCFMDSRVKITFEDIVNCVDFLASRVQKKVYISFFQVEVCLI